MDSLNPLIGLVVFVGATTACSTDDPQPEFRSIEPVCVEDETVVVTQDWVCEDDLVIDCNSEDVPAEIVVVLENGQCTEVDLQPVDGPFAPGEQDVIIVDGNTGQPVCQSTLEIRDEVPPQIETRDQSMWPPNHKFETFALLDCFEEVVECDPNWTARLTYVSSDEPIDDRGDGNTEPDIEIVDETTVSLRSERSGRGNGRVYTLGWLAQDTSGNVAEGTCRVSVDHDNGKKGAAVDDGEAYRVEVLP